MPTGYTADVVDGKITDFNRFALQCARAFGALINMRDDPWDAAIPDEFEPSNYNQKKLEESRERLLKLQKMTTEEVEEQCAIAYKNTIADREKYKSRQKLENDRLEAMAEHVRNWTPPSANHSEMKNFMLEQLRISKHDLSYFDKSPIKKLTPKEWLVEQIEEAHKDIGYHSAEYEKEVERTKGRNLWIKQLRASLKVPA
jgi:hypothetical protein